MANKPVVLPDTYSGEKDWDQWKYHFENFAAVNGWDDDNKLKWLKVRLIGRAKTAFQRLPNETKASFADSMTALKKRFDPPGRQARYQSEFHTRKKKATESWAEYAEDLETLAEKAFLNLGQDGREQLALARYLDQLDHPQIAFNVRQRKPGTMDEAVSATLEMENYASTKSSVAAVGPSEPGHEEELVSTISGARQAGVTELLQQLVQRMDRLESKQEEQSKKPPPNMTDDRDGQQRRRPTCWYCNKVGHLQRDCRIRNRDRKEQGN